MNNSRFKLYLIITLVLSGLLPIIGSIFLHFFLSDRYWIDAPLHSVFEALGSFTALSLALLILILKKNKGSPSYYLWVSCALIGMGILDGFHAFSPLGDSFTWLHGMAILIGGFLFALVWLPDRTAQSRLASTLPTIVAIATIIFGIFAVVFPDALPSRVNGGGFTTTANAINILSGFFFLSAAVYFLIRYQSNLSIQDFLFINFCLLNGWAGLLFPFSQLWYADGWFWHLLRLIAYLTVISYMFITFQRSEAELEQHRGHLEELVQKRTTELKITNEQLQQEIDERRRAEDKLQTLIVKLGEEKAKTEAIIAAIGDGIMIQDTNFKVLYQNRIHEDFAGSHIGEYCYKAFQGRDTICEGCPVELSFRDGKIHRAETTRATDRGILYSGLTGSPLRDSTGKIIAGIKVVRDITESKRVEEEKNKLLRAIASSTEGIAITDGEDRYIYVNAAHAMIYNYPQEELIGKTWWEITQSEIIAQTENVLYNTLHNKEIGTFSGEFLGLRKDGTTIPTEVRGKALWDEKGNYQGHICIVRDITERKLAEEKLRRAHDELEIRIRERTAELQEANIKLETEVADRRGAEKALKKERDRVQQYLDIAGTALVIIGADQKVSLINKKGCGILGYKENEIVGKNWFDSFISERMRDNVRTVFKKLISGEVEPVEYYENPVLTKNGEERLIAWHNTLLKDESGRNIGTLSSGEDITERRHAEEALSESEIRYRTLFNWSIDGVLIIDPETAATIEFNEAVHRQLGYTREEFKQIRISDYEAIETPEETRAHIEKILREGRDDFETQHRTKDGRLRDIMVTVKTIKLSDRIFIYSIFRDITERKGAEEALKEREHSYRTLSENLPGIVYRVYLRENNKMQFFNNMVQPMTGFLTEELMTGDVCSLDPLILPEDLTQVITTVKRAIMDNQPFQVEYRLKHKKGDIRCFLERGRPINGTDGNPLYIDGVIFDVTEGKKAEEQIREQASLLDNAQEAIGVRDLENNLIYWNKGAERLYGWTAKEAIGKNADELLYKEEPLQLIEAKRIVLEKGEWTGELHHITKDGRELIIESHWTLVRGSKGEPKSILVINTDITEKKKLESQLLRAQRMESIGTLAGGIAHDINNVLTPIMLSLQLLQEKFTDEESQNLLNILERSTQRGANLVKQVKSFARGVQGERVALQVSHLVSEITQMARETFPRSIEIRTDIQKDLLIISGDATQLHQVIMNMCVNARDVMPDGGILSISAENSFIDENYAHMNIDAKVGQYIVITVSDTGTGIPPEILDRIFEPFFTTKQPGKGTGLGLSTSLAIVKSHGGFITVYSEVGNGTVFKVYLPAVKTTEVQKVDEQLELLTGHGELILVVDDEAMVRQITSSILETHGYRVLTANDGKEAIKVYTKNREKIKAILMDMMMPVMDGQACISALCKVNPYIRIIAVSGLAEKEKLAKVPVTHVKAFLPKPYAAKILLKTIREVISAK